MAVHLRRSEAKLRERIEHGAREQVVRRAEHAYAGQVDAAVRIDRKAYEGRGREDATRRRGA